MRSEGRRLVSKETADFIPNTVHPAQRFGQQPHSHVSFFFCFLRPSFLPFFPSDRNLKLQRFQNLLTSTFKSEDFLSIIVYGCASTIGRPRRPLPSSLDKKQRSELVKNSSYTSGSLEWRFAFKAL
jgi:hypothetical protein